MDVPLLNFIFSRRILKKRKCTCFIAGSYLCVWTTASGWSLWKRSCTEIWVGVLVRWCFQQNSLLGFSCAWNMHDSRLKSNCFLNVALCMFPLRWNCLNFHIVAFRFRHLPMLRRSVAPMTGEERRISCARTSHVSQRSLTLYGVPEYSMLWLVSSATLHVVEYIARLLRSSFVSSS